MNITQLDLGTTKSTYPCTMGDDSRGRGPAFPQTPGSEPRSPRSPYGGSDGRLRARLEASSVGLEELNLLRQNHLRAVESVKAMLMANIPEEEAPDAWDDKVDGEDTTDVGGGAPEPSTVEEPQLKPPPHHQQRDVVCRKRASSMDMAVARSLALTAKKLAKVARGPSGVPSGRQKENRSEGMDSYPDQPHTRRGRSSSFSVEKHTSIQEQLKKGQSMSTLPASGRSQGHPMVGDGRRNSTHEAGQNSLSGSFLSLGTSPNSPMYNRSQVEMCTEQAPLTEQDFNAHFTSARNLSGSKLKYDFPSPMHAILLHYDKTNSPVLDSDSMTSDQDGKMRMRRASFSGPVGRRLSRQEVSYKLRKDSSLGELPTGHGYSEPDSKSSARSTPRDNDDGVGNFIEMLANRGLAKKRQEERDRKQRMMEALVAANMAVEGTQLSEKESIAEDINGSGSTKKADCDVSTTDSDSSKADSSGIDSSQSVDGDSGQWEGSNLSSSGKRGSYISIRSSTSSKASLSSEEGYYSHPGSPQNTHANNRFSIQSNGSLVSGTSLSFCQGDCSDEELVESPLANLPECTVPQSLDSSKTMTSSSSSCSTVEIIDYQNSPGVKRRFSTSSLKDLRGDKYIKGSTLPRTSTPLHDISVKALPKVTFDQTSKSETVKIRITKSKLSPINGMTRRKSESIDGSRDISPKVSFASTFDVYIASGSPKDNVESPGSPGLKKDSPSWGKLLPDAPRLPTWRQTSPKNDSPLSGSSRSRFECPITPTIKEEPKMEAEFTDPPCTPPAPSSLSIPVRDNVIMLSPPICKAPKVPSWRKRNKVSAAILNDSTPQLTIPAVMTPATLDLQELQKSGIYKQAAGMVPVPDIALVRRQSVSQMTNITLKLAEQKDQEPKVRPRSNSHSAPISLMERSVNRVTSGNDKLNHNQKQHKEHTRQKMEYPNIKITVAPEALHENKGSLAPSSLRIATANSERSPRLLQMGEKVSSPKFKVPPQPTLGRGYPSHTPHSDVTNVFQYPIVAEKASPKTPTSKDIHEILKNWVEAKTPTLPPTSIDLSIQRGESLKSTTLPRGFNQSQANKTKTVSNENSDMLRRSKRMFHSQELCQKDGKRIHDATQRMRITAVDTRMQQQLNRAINEKPVTRTAGQVEPGTNSSRPGRDCTDRPVTRTMPQHKGHEANVPGCSSSISPPSPLPQPRPRSQTWSRGQQPPQPTGKSNSKNCWMNEVVVPPRTPTCRAEARIYEGRSKQNEVRQVSQPQLQWFPSCTDLKDTFV